MASAPVAPVLCSGLSDSPHDQSSDSAVAAAEEGGSPDVAVGGGHSLSRTQGNPGLAERVQIFEEERLQMRKKTYRYYTPQNGTGGTAGKFCESGGPPN